MLFPGTSRDHVPLPISGSVTISDPWSNAVTSTAWPPTASHGRGSSESFGDRIDRGTFRRVRHRRSRRRSEELYSPHKAVAEVSGLELLCPQLQQKHLCSLYSLFSHLRSRSNVFAVNMHITVLQYFRSWWTDKPTIASQNAGIPEKSISKSNRCHACN